ncbi:hypothetical protein KMW28_13080 [Flammeovirga yaeyamensis]|uniref:Uncharacterized protein n=1 Tax=Flammeovirga yaeyamensis TaxID=367791 RepID=A0AAX1MZ91_9BACT|nr:MULTISPECIES: hypothetical protein [Flammeovirga]ANQ48013.1 hypothetical protein MY04_0631 [Flammeovirga sp. MY04]MBB3695895.1 hypothetical protein [Flammeovirga yaeyamensis]NMF34584.1 hypothetical protein [Flammeovirga yaeyamensis]QWG00586.1 hypothetical protein KMW28_13080 [Flammeovirga yaeyamensis]
MKHLILKKEIHLGYSLIVPEVSKMPISLNDLLSYMNFPINELSHEVVRHVMLQSKNDDSFDERIFEKKMSVDDILKQANYQFIYNLNDEKFAEQHLDEVNAAWDDFLEKITQGLMMLRYSILEAVAQQKQRLYS